MLLFLLSTIKILLFMNMTKIENHRGLVLLISLLVLIFAYSIIYLNKKAVGLRLDFLFYTSISLIMFADLVYYAYFNVLPSVTMLRLMGQLTAVGDSLKTLLSFQRLLFILDLPLAYLYSRKRRKARTYSRFLRWRLVGASGTFLVVILIILSKISLFEGISNQEFFTYHAKDIKKTLFKEDTEIRGALSLGDIMELRQNAKLIEGEYTGLGRGKNLIVIQVESLQNFVIDHYYKGQELTPNLNGLIRGEGSLYFNNYYQLIGRGNTADAEFVSHNSLYPSMEEPTYSQYPDNDFYSLPWLLRDKGYRAWAFHGYEKDFWNRDQAYVKQGFERFVSEEDYDLIESIGFGLSDGQFFKQSLKYLKELDAMDNNPFYAFMISLTSHNPYKMPEKYRYLKLEEEDEDTILGNYIQSIHYLDKVLGEFIEALKKEGLYKDTVLAIYGDHFAISSANEDAKKIMTDYLGYEYDLDHMMNVPLIIHLPNSAANENISRVGSMLDFMPTILNIMGYENKKGLMFGKDLINYQGENFVAPQTYAIKGSVITDEIFLEMSRDEIFENSRTYRLDTRELLNPQDYRHYHQKALEEINKSDYILKSNSLTP